MQYIGNQRSKRIGGSGAPVNARLQDHAGRITRRARGSDSRSFLVREVREAARSIQNRESQSRESEIELPTSGTSNRGKASPTRGHANAGPGGSCRGGSGAFRSVTAERRLWYADWLKNLELSFVTGHLSLVCEYSPGTNDQGQMNKGQTCKTFVTPFAFS